MQKIIFTIFILVISLVTSAQNSATFNVKDYGAVGDGIHLDTDAINQAIIEASKIGGGTVVLPAGQYLSFSIRLKDNINLHLDAGATLLAANMDEHDGQYDHPEPNQWGDKYRYQDFGHSHFQNSLIWGENLNNISITGSGLIYGKGLQKWGNPKKGLGNKSISLKKCTNVILKDFTVLHGGHFAIVTTGVNNLTIDNLKIDTNRDAIDIDGCKNVRVSNCSLNSPNDDALVLKSSYALGECVSTETITITNCAVSGYDEGSMLDGTFQKTQKQAPDKGEVTGRIKIGTESNGDFRNITISNCTFSHCRGLALETVDGANIENIVVNNLVMDDILDSPFFFRLGRRMRGPDSLQVGTFKDVIISDIIIKNSNNKYAAMIMGIPNHKIENVKFSNIFMEVAGGADVAQANRLVPEHETKYPDAMEFQPIPSYGFYVRHVTYITLENVTLEVREHDERPAFIFDDVNEVDLFRINSKTFSKGNLIWMKNVENILLKEFEGLKNQELQSVKQKKI